MKYRCLVLDHDDTSVRSTALIHYPAFCEILAQLRPGKTYSMEFFLWKNYTSGLGHFYRKELGFTDAEMDIELKTWQDYVARTRAPFFPGMPELIRRQKAEGGYVCVVSHSYPEFIRQDYRAAGLEEPDLIYGWDTDRSHCKPSPWPMQEILRLTGCAAEEAVMVDDLRPGLDMARNSGVHFAAACWGYDVPQIRDAMRENADFYLERVEDLARLQFGEAA